MLRFITLLVSPLLNLFVFLAFFSYSHYWPWFLAVALINILVSARFIFGRYFWSNWLLWLNLLLIYFSELLFLTLISSGNLRLVLAFLLSVFWGFIWGILNSYFQEIRNTSSRDYLLALRFFYYLNFWFLAVGLYALVIFISLPVLYLLAAILLISFLWSWQILKNNSAVSLLYVFLVSYLVLILAAALYLLPLNFYLVATILTLWFFILVDQLVNLLKRFKLYFWLFMAGTLLLLITSLI